MWDLFGGWRNANLSVKIQNGAFQKQEYFVLFVNKFYMTPGLVTHNYESSRIINSYWLITASTWISFQLPWKATCGCFPRENCSWVGCVLLCHGADILPPLYKEAKKSSSTNVGTIYAQRIECSRGTAAQEKRKLKKIKTWGWHPASPQCAFLWLEWFSYSKSRLSAHLWPMNSLGKYK